MTIQPPDTAKQADELLRRVSTELMAMVRTILDHSGYGSVTIIIEKGGVDELSMHVTTRPRQDKPR